jgi:hypothetical protein
MSVAPAISAEDALLAKRKQTLASHMEAEVSGDFEGVLATFDHPRYEVYGDGTVYDGSEAVLGYLTAWRAQFPKDGGELISMREAADALICEFWASGDNTGPLQVGGKALPATGKSYRVRCAAIFEFTPGSEKLSCEKLYIDDGAIWAQLGAV